MPPLPKSAARENLARLIRTVRRSHICAYRHGNTDASDICDCKFGIDCSQADAKPGHGDEASNGCPEMRVVEKILEVITQSEFDRVIARIQRLAERQSRRRT
jgi:hypothetical protein